MLSRRTMLRALGLGAPAAAVAVCFPAAAGAEPVNVTMTIPATQIDVGRLSAISANLGTVTALNFDGDFDARVVRAIQRHRRRGGRA